MDDAEIEIAKLRLHEVSSLQDMPPAIWIIIFSLFESAQTVARIATTCKRLSLMVKVHGWRTFTRSQFASLTLPRRLEEEAWMDLANKLTKQSRAWDRRSFFATSLVPPRIEMGHGYGRGRGRGRGGGGGTHSRTQTFPAHVVVDARSELQGQTEIETVAWGLGEDVIFRSRTIKKSTQQSETWTSLPGVVAGFRAGDDDVTAISIVDKAASQDGILVGRASGCLQLLSTDSDDVGRLKAWFQPLYQEHRHWVDQRDLQHLDTNASRDTMVVVTKENMLLYPLVPDTWVRAESTTDVVVEPTEALCVRDMPKASQFRFLREAKFMGKENIVMCMTSSPEPLRYVTRTPTGLVLSNAAKMQPSERCTASYILNNDSTQTARSVLPINATSTVGGYDNIVLSSYDDGTVRLQDMRTHCPFDTIFQDHFEVTTPVGPLLSYGTERFLVGSARMPILKIFDFRWTEPYSYTDAIPCSNKEMSPTPKALTGILGPKSVDLSKCCHFSHMKCRLHALARTDFYRPNCNLYVPELSSTATPVYSLAKSSDAASCIYAGLTRRLLRIGLRDEYADEQERLYMRQMGKENRCGYASHENYLSMVETGDGFALNDISQSKRLPLLFKQKRGEFASLHNGTIRRLDEYFV